MTFLLEVRFRQALVSVCETVHDDLILLPTIDLVRWLNGTCWVIDRLLDPSTGLKSLRLDSAEFNTEIGGPLGNVCGRNPGNREKN